MDQDTLTNHLTNMSKALFDIACRIVLKEVFNLTVINVDGPWDGGTDFTSFDKGGQRSLSAYQVTTQKKEIERKVYKDAQKVIERLGANKFYFITSISISETTARKLENTISEELKIPSICLGSKHIASFLIEESLLNRFLDEANYPLPRSFSASPDYREMALHAYTIMSDDARGMRDGIYDDTIIFIIADKQELTEHELIEETIKYLGLDENKYQYLSKRIGALFGKQFIQRTLDGKITISDKSGADLKIRRRIYEKELEDLSAAQIDLMRNEFDSNWSVEDSKSVSVFIADSYIADQVELLKEIKASIAINPILKLQEKGISSLKEYLLKKRIVAPNQIEEATEKLIKTASNHPLVTKLARASVYVALEGSNPIVSAKALGAGRWSDFNILVEPSVSIPWVCAQLFNGKVNPFFDASKRAIQKSLKLGSSLYISYFYLNECASHLLRARKYAGLDLNPEELRYSPNAYISNYYSLIAQGTNIPDNIMEYLRIFSPSVLVERHDTKDWVRSIMTDIQTILNKSGISFIESPKYSHEQCSTFETEYIYHLSESKLDKPRHLVDHDAWALQFTHDLITKEGQHWLILTYDRSMISVGRSDVYAGWVTTPNRFLDLTASYDNLSEAQYISLVHSLATYSERTLSAGARIIDKIVQYASSEMQNWEFKKDFEEFKKNIIAKTDLDSIGAVQQIDASVDSFLESHGIKISNLKANLEEVEVD
jgi:hypothetical protein